MNTCLVPSYLFEAWSVEQLKSPNLQISELHFHQQTQGSLPLSSFLTFRWSHNCLLPLDRSIHKLHPNHRQKELHCTRSRPKHLWAHKKKPPTMQLWMSINLPTDHPSCSLSMCVHLVESRMLIRVSQTPNQKKNNNLNHWCFSQHIAFPHFIILLNAYPDTPPIRSFCSHASAKRCKEVCHSFRCHRVDPLCIVRRG